MYSYYVSLEVNNRRGLVQTTVKLGANRLTNCRAVNYII